MRFAATAGDEGGLADEVRGWPATGIGPLRVRTSPDTSVLHVAEGPFLLVGELFDRAGSRVEQLTAAEVNAAIMSDGRWLTTSRWGRYVVFWRDPRNGDVCLARDPSGALPCFLRGCSGEYHLFSDLDLLSASLRRQLRVDETGLAHQLWYGGLPTRGTGLEGISEILPGEMLRLAREPAPMLLWKPWEFARPAGTEPAASVQSAVNGAVRALAAGRPRLLLELSGGLDSSILAGSLAAAGACFGAATIFAPSPEGDERSYARETAERAGSALDEIALLPSDVDLLAPPRLARVRPSGFGMLGAIDHALAGAANRAQASALVSGTGGDNVFCSLRSAAPILDAIRSAGLRPAIRAVADMSRLTGSPLPSVAAAALRYAARDWLRPARWRVHPLLLAEGTRPALETHPWLKRPRGSLPGTRAHIAAILRAQGVVGAIDRARTHDMIFPLLSQPVIEACLAIPSWLWVAGGIDRAVARDAFRDRLPASIHRRRSKGRLISLLAPAFDRDRARLETLLVEGQLAAIGLVNRDAVLRVTRLPAGPDDRPYTRVMEIADAELWVRGLANRT